MGLFPKSGTLPLERSLFSDFKLIVDDADPLSDPHSLIFKFSSRLQKKRSVTGLLTKKTELIELHGKSRLIVH